MSIKDRIAAMKLEKGDDAASRPKTVPRNFRVPKKVENTPTETKEAVEPPKPKVEHANIQSEGKKISGDKATKCSEEKTEAKAKEETQAVAQAEKQKTPATPPASPTKAISKASPAVPPAPASVDSPRLGGGKIEMSISYDSLHPDLADEDSTKNISKGENMMALARSRSQTLEQKGLLNASARDARGTVSKAAEKVKKKEEEEEAEAKKKKEEEEEAEAKKKKEEEEEAEAKKKKEEEEEAEAKKKKEEEEEAETKKKKQEEEEAEAKKKKEEEIAEKPTMKEAPKEIIKANKDEQTPKQSIAER
jgi:hypothetical protein